MRARARARLASPRGADGTHGGGEVCVRVRACMRARARARVRVCVRGRVRVCASVQGSGAPTVPTEGVRGSIATAAPAFSVIP